MSGQPEPERLLTPAEVAALFRVDPRTVVRWAKAGKLGCIRTLGGIRRYREAEVMALLAAAADGRCPECRHLLGSRSHKRACGEAS